MILKLATTPCWRIIGTRFPSADFFNGITDYGEWEDVAELEGLWDERHLGPIGNLATIPRDHRAYGTGSSYLMAPFAYQAPGRFGDGSYGVLYAALDERTALAEVAHHRAQFMRLGRRPKETMDHGVLTLAFEGTVEDIRTDTTTLPHVYAPDTWREGQAFGALVRAAGVDGIAYASVRRLGGECLAGFRPNAFSNCRFRHSTQFFWDGTALYAPGLPAC